MKHAYLLLFIFFLPLQLQAIEDIYPFSSRQQEKQFNTLTTELRCLVCQNQNLADSQSALADDLRAQIFSKIQQGQTNKEIISYLTHRYGDFILYRPPFNRWTVILWFFPLIILFSSCSYFMFYLFTKRKHKELSK